MSSLALRKLIMLRERDMRIKENELEDLQEIVRLETEVAKLVSGLDDARRHYEKEWGSIEDALARADLDGEP